jgi:hypothetical protein
LVKDGYATFGFVYKPVPAEAEVRWDEWPRGAHHAPRVNLEGIVPRDFTEGIIYFIIKPDRSVVVKPDASDDRKARLDAPCKGSRDGTSHPRKRDPEPAREKIEDRPSGLGVTTAVSVGLRLPP